jgi:acetolactate synthase small subunit
MIKLAREEGVLPRIAKLLSAAHVNQEGILVKSCWKLNKLGVMQIVKIKQKEWEERIKILKQQIQYWIDNPTVKTVEIIELFY